MDLGLRCSLLLLLSILVLSASGAQRCAPQPLPDMVIDIGLAVAQGARFTDPVKVANVEECVSACCRQLDAGGDRSCNLLVYDDRTPGLQNCYLFHCPTLDSCPLKNKPGVLSYSFWSDPSRPGKHDPDKEQPKSRDRSQAKTSGFGEEESGPDVNRKPSSAIASQVSADSSTSITSQLLHLAEEMDQHLEKMESEGERRVPSSPSAAAPALQTILAPVHRAVMKLPFNAKAAKSGKAKHKNPGHLPTTPERATPRRSTAAPRSVPPTSHVVPPAATHRVSGTKEVPGSNVSSTTGSKVSPTEVSASNVRSTTGSKVSPTEVPGPNVRGSKVSPTEVPGSNVRSTTGSKVSPTVVPGSNVRGSKVSPTEVPGSNVRSTTGSKVRSSKVSPTEVPALTTTRHTRPPHLATRPVPSWTSPWKGIKLSTENNDLPAAGDEGKTPGRVPPESYTPAREEPAVNLEEAPRKVAGAGSAGVLPPPGDMSGLVAALIFGMLFLMVVIGLVSRKVSEAQRRHRYTKLDYLINGMYVDT